VRLTESRRTIILQPLFTALAMKKNEELREEKEKRSQHSTHGDSLVENDFSSACVLMFWLLGLPRDPISRSFLSDLFILAH
jgi:hypothetical protein